MIAAVLDTHTVIWLLHADTRLSARALRAIETATTQQTQVTISSISLVETAYLEEKGRIPIGTLHGLLALLDKPESQLVETPVSRSVIASLLSISRETVPDMPDRVIAATALSLAVPVISRDGKIRDSQVETIW